MKLALAVTDSYSDYRTPATVELECSMKRAELGGIQGLPLVRTTLPALARSLPDLKFPCLLGCGEAMTAAAYIAHESICPSAQRLIKGRLEVPRIGSKPDFVEYQVG